MTRLRLVNENVLGRQGEVAANIEGKKIITATASKQLGDAVSAIWQTAQVAGTLIFVLDDRF